MVCAETTQSIHGMTQPSLWQPSDIMSAETGTEADAPKKRGRIPQSAWPRILERHRAGVTLSAIAREFDCTPSAISYIVRKAEAAGIEPAESTFDAPDAPDAPAATMTATTTEPEAMEARMEARTTEVRPEESKQPETAEPAPAPVRPAPAPPPRPMPAAARPVPILARSVPTTPQPLEIRTPAPAPVAAADPVPAEAPRPAPAAEAPRPVAAPPIDAVEARLRETARGCLSAYRGWRQIPSEGTIQSLHDAVHDLRKVLARLEIDMSASRRDEQVMRPIPIPTHRAARRPRAES